MINERELLKKALDALHFALPGTDLDQSGGLNTYNKLYCTDCGRYEAGYDEDEIIIHHELDCLTNRIESLMSEIQDELAKPDNQHIRVYATKSIHSGIWADTVNGVEKRNATLVLDDGIEL